MSTIGSNKDHSAGLASDRGHSLAIRDDLKAYADGELSRLRCWQIRRHLSVCPDCRKEIMGLNRVSEEMRNLPLETPRPELRARILASLPDAPPVPVRPAYSVRHQPLQQRLAFAGATCALLLITFSALAIMRHQSRVPAAQALVIKRGPVIATTVSPTAPPDLHPQTDDRTLTASTLPTPADDSNEMTDATSREADRILRTRIADLDRAVQRARKESRQIELNRQHALLAAARTKPEFDSQMVRSNSSLLIAVADVAAAREKLRSLVQNVGGSFTEQAAGFEAPKTSGDGPQPPNNGDSSGSVTTGTAPVISIRMPMANTGPFMGALRDIGVPTVWKHSGDRPVAAVAPSPGIAMPAPRGTYPNHAASINQARSPETEPSQEDYRHPTADERQITYATITIRLQISKTTPH